MTKNSKLILLIPALLASILDVIVTTLGQPKEYWEGNLTRANEGNPIDASFMNMHVSGLFLISGFWLVVIGLLGYFLPLKLSKIFLLFVVIAHSFGASTWLTHNYGFWWAMALIFFNSALYIIVNDSEYNRLTKKAAHNINYE